jgi:hypothetical protein
MGQSKGIVNRQLMWGVIIGVITFGFMAAAYYIGTKRNDVQEVKGEVTVATDREIEIAVLPDCSTYSNEQLVEESMVTDKYCVVYQEGESAFDVMKRLDSERDNFSFAYEESDFGVFITSINNYHPDINTRFWAFLVNDELSLVGVDGYKVKEGDQIGFKVEDVQF